MEMKSIFLIVSFVTFMFSCKSLENTAGLKSCVNKEGIEKLLEISLPDCYTKVENPRKINKKALQVEELVFPSDCFEKFLDDISKQMPIAYCGTRGFTELTMSFCTRDNSAKMTINLKTRILHFEKHK